MKRILLFTILLLLLLLPVSAGAEEAAHEVILCHDGDVLSVDLEYTVSAEPTVTFSEQAGVLAASHYADGSLYIALASADAIDLAKPLAELSGAGEITLESVLINGKTADVRTSHTEVTLPGRAPTVDTEGLTEGHECSHCGAVLVPQEVIPATGPVITAVRTGSKVAVSGMLSDSDSIPGVLWVASYTEQGRMLTLSVVEDYTANDLSFTLNVPAAADHIRIFMLNGLLPERPPVQTEIE